MPVHVESQVSLPPGPNCVAYSAEASVVLGRWDEWHVIQGLALEGLRRYHASSGHDAAVWFSRREHANRKNEARTHLRMMFVLDGIATREQLAVLDATVLGSQQPWDAEGAFPLPNRSFPSLLVKEGRAYRVWVRDELGVGALAVHWHDDYHLRRITPDTARDDHFLPGLPHAVGLVPEIETTDKQQMLVAFAMRVAEEIVGADEVVEDAEIEFLQKVFPFELTERLGLHDPSTYQALGDRARAELPNLLGHHEKLALLGLFYSACYADGVLEVRELTVMREAAEQLGLEKQEIVDYLRKLW